jgi:subtilisin family serine protease
MKMTATIRSTALALLVGLGLAGGAAADGLALHFGAEQTLRNGTKTTSTSSSSPVLRSWMSPEIGDAWKQGYQGSGVTITVIDDFKSGSRIRGDLGLGTQRQRHGEWTRQEAGMVAPSATMRSIDFSSTGTVSLARGLNALNLSYGMFAAAGHDVNRIAWSDRERSIITYARDGSAVISKAAGNDGIAVRGVNASGNQDYLNLALVGAQSGIFVGALERNGTTGSPARLAGYSNFAGSDPAVQQNFLVVGVEGHKTNLYGTSFAAPIVSSYAAVLGSKFTSATPTQIVNQLLSTARTDTVSGYSAAIHGRGEASITRALAPASVK